MVEHCHFAFANAASHNELLEGVEQGIFQVTQNIVLVSKQKAHTGVMWVIFGSISFMEGNEQSRRLLAPWNTGNTTVPSPLASSKVRPKKAVERDSAPILKLP